MNKVIICPYFGRLPDYFELFLDSCSKNADFDFLMLTDQELTYDCPKNVRFVRMSFQDIRELIIEKLGKSYFLFSPYKLCDYRPAYGEIFEDYIHHYDFWGYCDIDLILGKISNFICEADFVNNDKLLINGHLTFYRNSDQVNQYYTLKSNVFIDFDTATAKQVPCFFDEISMPGILNEHGISQYSNWNYLDILPQRFDLIAKEQDGVRNHKDQHFYYRRGKVFQEYTVSGKVHRNEYMYIHLQKRKMSYVRGVLNFKSKIYFSSNIITNLPGIHSGHSAGAYAAIYYIKQIKKLNIARVRIKLYLLALRIRQHFILNSTGEV